MAGHVVLILPLPTASPAWLGPCTTAVRVAPRAMSLPHIQSCCCMFPLRQLFLPKAFILLHFACCLRVNCNFLSPAYFSSHALMPHWDLCDILECF